MRRNPSTALRYLAVLSLSALVLPLSACAGGRPSTTAKGNGDGNAAAQLAFGVSMAQRGLWQEALFRFREAERLDPTNPRVHNNLGVASEAAGDFDGALKYYKKALEVDPGSREAKANYARFVEFYQSFKPKPKEPKTATAGKPGDAGKTAKPGDAKKGDAQAAAGSAGSSAAPSSPPPPAAPPADQPPTDKPPATPSHQELP